MKEQKNILQHFPTEQRDFAEKIIDSCQQVERSYSYRLTPFLNPKQEQVARVIAQHFNLTVYSTRDFLVTEFSRLIIAPDYYQLEMADFQVELLEVIYNQKFHRLSHAQILGTLLHQLGIKREFIGDIIVSEELTAVLIDRRFVSLIEQEVGKLARVPVRWHALDLRQVSLPRQQDGIEKTLILSSLRLDKLLATSLGLSRSRAVDLIEAGQVKVDYVTITQVSRPIEIGQLVSIRGFGRIHLIELVGKTKQDKFKVIANIISR